jgi:Gpi18-like mannosyltransferase
VHGRAMLKKLRRLVFFLGSGVCMKLPFKTSCSYFRYLKTKDNYSSSSAAQMACGMLR